MTFALFFVVLVSKHRTIMNVFQKEPIISKDAFVAPSAAVMGDVLIGRGSSVWYGVVLRGNKLSCLCFSCLKLVHHRNSRFCC
jgi:hypothetical protein